MKNRILSAILASAMAMTACGAASSDAYQHISQEKAKEMMDTQEVLILDVREQDEYDGGHIPGAVLLPVGAGKAGLELLGPGPVRFHLLFEPSE